ncbi:unnamed protein product [Camellia sinensis]
MDLLEATPMNRSAVQVFKVQVFKEQVFKVQVFKEQVFKDWKCKRLEKKIYEVNDWFV